MRKWKLRQPLLLFNNCQFNLIRKKLTWKQNQNKDQTIVNT